MLSPKRILLAFSYTVKPLRSTKKTEDAFRDDVLLVILVQLLCLWFQPPLWLWLLFGLTNALLLVTELLNTGLEYIADHISTDTHSLLGSAKNVDSEAVFVLLFFNSLLLGVIAYLHWFD